MHELVSKLLITVFFPIFRACEYKKKKKTCYFQNKSLKEITLPKFVHTNQVSES
jgi:hypothetical protein